MANQQANIFGVEYEISAQRPYAYAAEFNPGQLLLQESVMRLRLRLLHEEDLPRFLQALGRQGGGFFTVDQCIMKRLRPGEAESVLQFQPNLSAECELSWLTAKPATGDGEKRMKRTIALLLGLTIAGAAPAAETFGRFFFTPAERAQLDLARAQNRAPQPKPAEPAETAPAPQVLTYSGMVRRSDGKSVLWLNNRPVDEKEALSSLAVTGRVRSDGAVTVRFLKQVATSISK